MKALAIAQKELLQSFRSLFAIFFMLVIPLLLTGLFYVMFGGGDEAGITLPQTAVIVVNLDEPVEQELPFALPEGTAESASGDGEGLAMGRVLLSALQDEGLADLMAVTEATDAEAARAAVDEGEAGVALIIPPNFSAVLTGGEGEATLDFYQDPTLALGPAIVRGVVSSVVDQFLAGRIGIGVAIEQAARAGVAVDEELVNEIVAAHIEPAEEGGSALLVVRNPAGGEVEAGANDFAAYLGLILAGQMVFFGFFTGASSLQSILVEDEKGTLSRLFTTPTSHLSIMGGKVTSALLLLAIQFIVLVVIGALVFNIYWGVAISVLLAGVGLAIGAAMTGLFLVSMMRTSRQGGIVFGGLLTVTGMMGMLPVFTASVPDPPEMVNTIALLTPQGWALRGISQAMSDAGLPAVALNTAVLLFGWGLVFALIAQYRLRRRFDR